MDVHREKIGSLFRHLSLVTLLLWNCRYSYHAILCRKGWRYEFFTKMVSPVTSVFIIILHTPKIEHKGISHKLYVEYVIVSFVVSVNYLFCFRWWILTPHVTLWGPNFLEIPIHNYVCVVLLEPHTAMCFEPPLQGWFCYALNFFNAVQCKISLLNRGVLSQG